MIGIIARQTAYEAKLTASQLETDLIALMPNMIVRMAAVVPAITAMELQVKQVCDGAGVSVIELPFYLCFGRECFGKIRKDISGETLAIEVALLIAKWTGRGLTSAVLQGIRTDVFNIAAPIGP